MIRNSCSQSGFSLIEMLVSLALFSVVVTVSVGALLVLVSSNEQLQNEQSVLTNLSFALDSMTREIRTGTNYYCDSQNSTSAGSDGKKIFKDDYTLDQDTVGDCPDGNPEKKYHGLSFVESGQSITEAPNTRIVYFFDKDQGKIMRRVSGQKAQSIVSSGIFITNAEFFVTGSSKLSADPAYVYQPTVTVFIEAKEANSSTAKTYQVQTTVTQRTLDI